jgi:hypothetical protein
MGNTGLVRAYSRQFDEKLNDLMKQRISYFAFQVARHVYYKRPTHAHIDSAVVGDCVELEFHADSESEKGLIRRIETNNIRYSHETAPRLREQRISMAKTGVMEYGIPFDSGKGNTTYLNLKGLETPDIDKSLLDQIFTGSCIMPAVGSEIPAVLNKKTWCMLDLPDIAHSFGYVTPESALEKIRMFYERRMSREIALSE